MTITNKQSEAIRIRNQATGLGIEFFDGNSQRFMKYVYPDSDHWTAGWILFRHPDGQWVTLRRATDADIEGISAAVIKAHHEAK